ncbi:MAG: hypothetical protein AAF676_17275, partial [Pseudomonadota bacterium]
GDDEIRGNGGNDRLYGEPGEDEIRGGKGADRMWGGPDDDFIYSTRGKDRIWGDDGDDFIRVSSAERVRVRGGEGEDEMHFFSANVIVTGGSGDDDFVVLHDGNGTEFVPSRARITDFAPGDALIIKTREFNFNETTTPEQSGPDVIIRGPGGLEVILQNVEVGDLRKDIDVNLAGQESENIYVFV